MTKGWRNAPGLASAALGVALLSLALNGYLLLQLRNPQRSIAPLVARSLQRLAAQDATLRYQVRIPPGTPLRFDIPVRERLQIRLNTELPIDTRIRLPIRSPLGTYNVSVPVQTTIPIRTTVPLQIRHTFRLRTQTQDELVVPLELRARDLPVDAILQSLRP